MGEASNISAAPLTAGGTRQQTSDDELAANISSAQQHLAAIVESSDDAIITTDLRGTITSWNNGAERLYGYCWQEVVGKPVEVLIPKDRINEEPFILARIRAGERVSHYETLRRRKDGTLVHVSLGVSPLRDENGKIVGASKIARDVSEKNRAEEQQRLLLREMQHRVKNVFSLANSLIRLCARDAQTASELADLVSGRLEALARANALTLHDPDAADQHADQPTTLHTLIHVLVAPYVGDDKSRFCLCGEDISISPRAVTPLALVINELATNAMKHGALHAEGTITVECALHGSQFVVVWTETGSSEVGDLDQSGFGTRLTRTAVEIQLGGTINREPAADGLVVTIAFDLSRL